MDPTTALYCMLVLAAMYVFIAIHVVVFLATWLFPIAKEIFGPEVDALTLAYGGNRALAAFVVTGVVFGRMASVALQWPLFIVSLLKGMV